MQGLVKSTNPTTLLEAVEKARDLQHILPRERTLLQQEAYSGPRKTIHVQDLEVECVAVRTHHDKTFSKKDASVVPPTKDFAPRGRAIAVLRGVPKYLILRVRGNIMGKRVSVLIDSGDTHNFIDEQLVQRRGIHMEEF